MLTVTDVAAEKAKEILEAEGKPNWGLRIFVAGSGCCGPSYGMDIEETPKGDDTVIEKNGLKVFTDNASTEKLKGMEVDFIDDGQNQGFVVKYREGMAPDASGGCGCSSSGGCGTGSSGGSSCC